MEDETTESESEQSGDVEIETEWGVCENVEVSMADLMANGFEPPPDEHVGSDYPVA